eukprot:Selendium_serpulae@DN4229_c0_g1_i1.p2
MNGVRLNRSIAVFAGAAGSRGMGRLFFESRILHKWHPSITPGNATLTSSHLVGRGDALLHFASHPSIASPSTSIEPVMCHHRVHQRVHHRQQSPRVPFIVPRGAPRPSGSKCHLV